LAEGKRLAFLHNWPKAAPLFAQAEKLLAASGDHFEEIYAHVGRVRGEVESLSLPEVSNDLADVLQSPSAQSDSQLRLFCLVAKGDIDFQIDPKSSEAVWNEVAKLAGNLGMELGKTGRERNWAQSPFTKERFIVRRAWW
jgi:hypothetical protein